MGYLPLIYVYGEHPRLTTDQTEIDQKNVSFKRVRTRVNDLIRATGLRNTTPQDILDKCLGTNLVQFARQGVIQGPSLKIYALARKQKMYTIFVIVCCISGISL